MGRRSGSAVRAWESLSRPVARAAESATRRPSRWSRSAVDRQRVAHEMLPLPVEVEAREIDADNRTSSISMRRSMRLFAAIAVVSRMSRSSETARCVESVRQFSKATSYGSRLSANPSCVVVTMPPLLVDPAARSRRRPSSPRSLPGRDRVRDDAVPPLRRRVVRRAVVHDERRSACTSRRDVLRRHRRRIEYGQRVVLADARASRRAPARAARAWEEGSDRRAEHAAERPVDPRRSVEHQHAVAFDVAGRFDRRALGLDGDRSFFMRSARESVTFVRAERGAPCRRRECRRRNSRRR